MVNPDENTCPTCGAEDAQVERCRGCESATICVDCKLTDPGGNGGVCSACYGDALDGWGDAEDDGWGDAEDEEEDW